MSTVQKSIWTTLPPELDSKYEKCRNITEEIYKRINITFQIKKLETNLQSDLSDNSEEKSREETDNVLEPKTDQIDSNELSNETDLFACDKSSISSSTELEALEQGSAACEKFINNNNNEEKVKKTAAASKRPRKRFRKRVKKQQPSRKDSDGSSDEAIPLSRVVVDNRATRSPLHSFMGVPNVVITPIDFKKLKLPIPPEVVMKKSEPKQTHKQTKRDSPKEKVIDKSVELKRAIDKSTTEIMSVKEKSSTEWHCTLCSLSFKGERGLRRHMTMSHLISPDDEKKNQ